MQATAAWHARLTPTHWRVLAASFLGWIFDGYETYALIVTIGAALGALLAPEQLKAFPFYAGIAIGLTLLGWGIGGIIGSTLADYVGRKRMMLISILAYALFTGLTGLSQTYWMLVALRFLTGLALGSEWSSGTALIAETWPNEARPKGAGFMQSAFGFGTFLAALVWFVASPLGHDAWRWVFFVGVIPAFFTFYIRRSIGESERWLAAVREKRWAATEADAASAPGSEARPFTLAEIFREPESRRRVILGVLLSLSTMVGWWAISSWLPLYVQSVAKAAGQHDLVYWGSLAGLIYTAGAIVGYLVSGFLADALGRRWYLAFLFAGSLVVTPLTYLWAHSLSLVIVLAAVNGFFTLGQYSWFAIYLPELFTSSVRSTAIGFIFNSSRLIAFLGPIAAGSIIAFFGGIPTAAVSIGTIYLLGLVVAPFMPETRGRPLPE